jgi:hypothetical protein
MSPNSVPETIKAISDQIKLGDNATHGSRSSSALVDAQ